MGDKLTPHGPKHPEWEASGKQVGDKLKSHGPENPGASGGQVGNKSQLHGPGRPDRVASKWETSGRQVKATWHPEWEASGRQAGDKLKSHGPEHPEWEASGTSGRQVKVT